MENSREHPVKFFKKAKNFFCDDKLIGFYPGFDKKTNTKVLKFPCTVTEFCFDCSCHGKLAGKIKDIEYSFNSDGFRSKEFKDIDTANSFIYAGCSSTMGTALPNNVIWPQFLNEKLNGRDIINLGLNGGSVTSIITNIYRYIKKYGKPLGIFVVFPNLSRLDVFLDEEPERIFSTLHFNDKEALKIIPKDMGYKKARPEKPAFDFISLFYIFNTQIKILEDYLDEIGVSFFWTTWDKTLSDIIERHNLDYKRYTYFAKSTDLELINKYKDHHYFKYGRDNKHFGIETQIAIAQSFFEEWRKNEKGNS